MTTTDYHEFLATKARRVPERGLKRDSFDLHPSLFGYQRECTEFALRVGCGAQFLDTGMGKSFIELEWQRVLTEEHNKPTLMLAPIAVGQQHVKEARRFGIDARYVKSHDDVKPGINITNYERLHLFDPRAFCALAGDESSILKSFTGATTRKLMEFGSHIPYLMAATATPAPNDHMELGQHCQFLGVMDSSEMLARWFISDQSEMGRYRLKGYAVRPFWAWVSSWARCLSKPSDLGYSDDGFILPKLETTLHAVETDLSVGAEDGQLFRIPTTSATSIHTEKRLTADDRAEKVAEIVAREPNERWVIWVETNYDADAVLKRIPEAVEVRGSMTPDEKESRLVDFSEGNTRVILTKPRIAGFGLNWQHCARTVFAGVSFSYEAYYQAVRRFWRFGQHRPVHAHVVLAETELQIWQAITRKQSEHSAMKSEMVEAMSRESKTYSVRQGYAPTKKVELPRWMVAA
jgi:superfamily II DNA or RNA helicase